MAHIWSIETASIHWKDFPGGPMVKNLPSNARDVSSIPGQGTKILHAAGHIEKASMPQWKAMYHNKDPVQLPVPPQHTNNVKRQPAEWEEIKCFLKK